MNRGQFQGHWNELKGRAKEKWGELTNGEIDQVNGNYDQLIGRLQQKYGYQKEKAEEEINNWK